MALPNSRSDREQSKFVETAGGDVAVRTTATITGDINVDSNSVSTSGYVGKASGTNADFITAYASGTTFTCATLPSGVSSIEADDIVSITQVATGGGVTETYTRDDAVITSGGTDPSTITVTGATFAASDTFVVYTNINRSQTVAIEEFPAAAAITDNFANPTTTNVMAMGMAYDGSTWDRMLGNSTDGLLVNLGANNDVTVTSGAITETNSGTIAGDTTSMDGKMAALGQGAMAASMPVVVASDQSAIPVTMTVSTDTPESGTDDTGANAYATVLTPSKSFEHISIVNEGSHPATVSIDGGSTDTFIRIAGASAQTFDGVAITNTAIQAKNRTTDSNYTDLTITVW